MFINIQIKSKNRNSLKNFITDFKKLSKNKKLKLNRFFKIYNKQQNNKTFTILKSPHVNKTAQKQFEYNLYSKNFKIKSFQILKILTVLKHYQKFLYTDIDLKIKFIIKKQNNNEFQKLKNSTFIKSNNIIIYLLMLNFYGNQKF